ncbi:hypothetical protein [Streptomyces griseomycini]|uniref:Uncharacterized protein n=1 Tax=Streptomyces griseomycini TaxID=66895 RepID=A0A7W7PWM2_9ACTN|nr:hypothetical protein [Streptomyces griseomycini]MBB4902576.1 hypothetical protein [Streptomyces griseomycini]GGR54268.1 hypothetical protein GCM10015536_69470 [Streptomyces griseomycini]
MPRRHSRTTPQRHEREARRAAFDDLLPRLEAGTLTPEQAAVLAAHVREEVRLGVKTGKSLAKTNRRLARHREAADAAIREAEQRANARPAPKGSTDAVRIAVGAATTWQQKALQEEGADTMRRRALAEALDVHPDTPWPTLIDHAREAHQWATRAAAERQERATGPECEHGSALVEFQTVTARVCQVLQEAEEHREATDPSEREDCAMCGRDHAAEALRVIRGAGAPSVGILVDCAQLTRQRDGWQLRAKLAEGELRTLRTAVRALGGDPTQVQNLWAQLRLRNRQWADAKRERDRYAARCGEAEAGEDVARHRAERAVAALGDVLGLLRPVRINGAVAFYQATEHPIRPDRYAWWAEVLEDAERSEDGPRLAVRVDQDAEHAGRTGERRTSPRVEQGAAAGSN